MADGGKHSTDRSTRWRRTSLVQTCLVKVVDGRKLLGNRHYKRALKVDQLWVKMGLVGGNSQSHARKAIYDKWTHMRLLSCLLRDEFSHLFIISIHF